MLKVSELSQLYNSSYFGISTDSYIWQEKQANPTSLAKVEFLFKGGRIGYMKSNLLNETKGVYNQNATEMLNLRKICDGILFLERDNQHFIVFLEMKSGFNDVRKKAIEQLPPSYIKLKSILNDFVTYNKDDFREFGLIVSYPYSQPPTSSANNQMILANKRAMVGNRIDIVKNKYSGRLRDRGQVDFIGADFGVEQLRTVKQDLVFDRFPVRYLSVKNYSVEAVVDLDSVIVTL